MPYSKFQKFLKDRIDTIAFLKPQMWSRKPISVVDQEISVAAIQHN